MTNLLIISHSNNNWPTPEINSSAIMLMVFPFISRFSLHFILFWPMVRNSVSWCFIFNWLPNFHNISYLYWSVGQLQPYLTSFELCKLSKTKKTVPGNPSLDWPAYVQPRVYYAAMSEQGLGHIYPAGYTDPQPKHRIV